MKSKMQLLIALVLLAALFLTSCVPPEPPSLRTPVEPQDAAAPVAVEPAATIAVDDGGEAGEVARLFFEAYIETVNSQQQAFGNPEFSAQKYLGETYLKQVAEIKAGFEGFGFDPVLQAQNPPPGPVEVKEARVAGSQATVVLQFGRGMLEQPWERIVSLEKSDGEWLIVPDRLEEGALTPEETVEAFYAWYLRYIGTGEQMRNPLADQAYRAAPNLDTQFISRVDRMSESGFGYDPFLCAQDVPETMRVVSSFENAAHPIVVVESSFDGHFLTADLIRSNFNQWTIRNITCGASPTGIAKAFYTWALGYMTQEGEVRNPWVEGAYRSSPYLAQTFIEQLDGMLASDEPLIADPVLLAQDLPQSFDVAPCPEENCALVNMQFGEATIRQLRVEMEAGMGRPLIASITHAQQIESPVPADPLVGVDHWVPFRDEQYGYAICYPGDWRPVGLKVTNRSDAAEYPVLRSIYFMPSATDMPYYPIQIDVFSGTQSQLIENYALEAFGELLEQKTINETPVKIYLVDPGMVLYVFQHPAQTNTWMVITDMVTQFPGREEAAKQVDGVLDRMITTISFAR